MNLAVFVNTCDSFQDCWPPFFKLFNQYGGILRDLPVYLNTERALYTDSAIDVRSTKVWPEEEAIRPSWSECLIRGLDAIPEKYLLFLLEDYFIKQAVPDTTIEEAMKIFEVVPDAGAVHLSRRGPRGLRNRPYSGKFLEVGTPAHYLINTQAAIWEKSFLRSLLKDWENIWMFEKFASLRALRTQGRIFKLTAEALRAGEGIDYMLTGVCKGRWKMECVEVFEKHGIEMDFSRRGFYKEVSVWKSRIEVLGKLFGRPSPALRSIGSLVGFNGPESS